MPTLRFAQFVLDPEKHRLEQAGVEVELQPLLFDLLVTLTAAPGALLTREALSERLWPNVHVADGSLSQAVRRLRSAIGDPAKAPRFIETVHRKGYRWTGDLHVEGAPAPVSPTHTPPGVPRATDRFVGRIGALAQLRAALAAARVVTVLGPGGIGKSRLAVEALGGVGAVPVSLTGCREPADVLGAVGAALGLARADRPSVRDAVAAWGGVLLLDGVEGVSGLAELVADWVAAEPGAVTVLATSQVRIGLGAERVVELTGLPEDEAVTLYRDRATAVAPTAEDPEPDVRALVTALGGMPLAIELAASRRRVLSAAAMLARIDAGLTSSEALLSSDQAGRPPHHRSLRAALDWSWSLLDEPARQAACRMSRFLGAPTLDTLERVLRGEALAAIERLRDASWVQESEGRFSMLTPVRAYVAEQLAARGAEQVAEADRRYVEAVAAHAAVPADGRVAALWADRADLHQALAMAREPSAAVALVAAVYSLEGGLAPMSSLRRALDRAAALSPEGPDLTRLWLVRARLESGDRPACLAATDEVLARTVAAPRSLERADALQLRAFHLWAEPETVSAGDAAVREALAIAREADDPELLARVLRRDGVRLHQQGRYASSRFVLREAASLVPPEVSVAGAVHLDLALVERMLYEVVPSHEHATAALEHADPRHERIRVATALEEIATICAWEARDEEAMALLEQSAHALPPGPSPYRAWNALLRAQAHLLRGQAHEGQRALDAWLAQSPGLSYGQLSTLAPLARLHGLRGEWDDADRLEAQRLDAYARAGRPIGVLESLVWRAVHAGVRGQLGGARRFAELASATSVEGPLGASYVAVAEAAVALASVVGGDPGGREPLAQAVARVRAMGARGRGGRPAQATAVRMALRTLEAAL